MDDIVLFNIALDKETHLWNITSVDPQYEDCSVYQIIGGHQFMVMQNITEDVANTYSKVAAFKIIDDAPELNVLQIETINLDSI
jgi:hypothetical protein